MELKKLQEETEALLDYFEKLRCLTTAEAYEVISLMQQLYVEVIDKKSKGQ